MRKKVFFLISIFSLAILSCEEEEIETANRVSFENDMVEVLVPEDAVNYERIINVYTSTISSSDREFQVTVNEDESTLNSSEYSLPTSVSIPANTNIGQLLLTVSDISLSFESKTLSLDLVSNDLTYTGSTILNVSERCDDTIVALKLTFDGFAEEAYWEIYDLSGTPTVVHSGGQGGSYTDLDDSELDIEFCLESGSYGVIVYDAYGDGGTAYAISLGETVLASGTVPGGNQPNNPTNSSSQFIVE